MTLIQFNTAKLAKEKGFNLKVYDYYYDGELKCDSAGYGIDDEISNHKDLRGDFNNINEQWLKTLKYHYESIKDLSLDELRIFWNNKDIKDHIKEIEAKKANLDNYLTQCSAPTQSELQKWLRDVHKIFVEPILQVYPSKHTVRVCRQTDEGRNLRFRDDETTMGYISYELALERGLFEALKLIENGNN